MIVHLTYRLNHKTHLAYQPWKKKLKRISYDIYLNQEIKIICKLTHLPIITLIPDSLPSSWVTPAPEEVNIQPIPFIL